MNLLAALFMVQLLFIIGVGGVQVSRIVNQILQDRLIIISRNKRINFCLPWNGFPETWKNLAEEIFLYFSNQRKWSGFVFHITYTSNLLPSGSCSVLFRERERERSGHPCSFTLVWGLKHRLPLPDDKVYTLFVFSFLVIYLFYFLRFFLFFFILSLTSLRVLTPLNKIPVSKRPLRFTCPQSNISSLITRKQGQKAFLNHDRTIPIHEPTVHVIKSFA